ncbi:hypothetical protein I7I50_03822 [Histoplasma capsulatum G186AR]|uniref:Uncharacterized protein n=1 Tax=Ajellomyces capsulatus TaxID=5037 RepID=A0A8H7YLR4_AJECA|nr:hypothetical protein I7I52_04730 [Histoplasma capsulatum]QSS74876.1 hypothetical protein I7I50_03822 [Histoplasma capsulatum G186AR]
MSVRSRKRIQRSVSVRRAPLRSDPDLPPPRRLHSPSPASAGCCHRWLPPRPPPASISILLESLGSRALYSSCGCASVNCWRKIKMVKRKINLFSIT